MFNAISGSMVDGLLAKYAPRLAAIGAAWIVTWGTKKGYALDQQEVVVLMLTIYAIVHRLISKVVNPGDATKATLIREDKAKLS